VELTAPVVTRAILEADLPPTDDPDAERADSD
jgi:hypothetical protein